MQLKLRIAISAVAILIGMLADASQAQAPDDDERIWFELDMQGRLDPDPSNSDYRGGRVSFRVSGLLEPAEYDDTSLVAFDNDRLPFTLTIEPCKRIDEASGEVSTTFSCRVGSQANISVHLLCNLETGLGMLHLVSWNLTTCTEMTHGYDTQEYEHEINYDIYLGSIEDAEAPNSTPPLSLTRSDLQVDFEKTFVWEQGDELFYCPNNVQGRITLRSRPPDETKVTLAGCADIMIGVAAEITATAEPEGGTYTWSVEPADVFSISGSGSTATVTGKSAGHASIRVEYQPKRGKKVEATSQGSVVELLSVNGGADIPQIGLYDETGAAKPSVQIPTAQDPPDGSLMSFPATDPGVARVENLGSGILIQGVHEGVTTAQGKTACGDQDEHIITIEVVPCDKETKQKIRDQIKDLKTQIDDNNDQIQRLINDPEYKRATRELDKHLIRMAVKALGILGTAAGAQGTVSSGTLPKVTDADNLIDLLDEGYDATETGTWDGRWSATDIYWDHYISLGKKLTIGVVNDLIDYGKAGLEVGHDLDVMKANSQALQEPLRRSKELQNEYDEANRRQVDICKDYAGEDGKPGEPQPPEPPPAEPKPPTPQPPTPKPAEPPPPQPGEPTEPEPPVPDNDDIIADPPLPPATPPGSSGGFQVECGCEHWDQTGWSNSPEGIGRIGQDIGSMVPCLEEFNQNTARSMEIVTDSTSQLFQHMEEALTLPEAQRVQAFRDFLPIMSDLKARYTQLGSEFRSMSDSLSRCGPKFERAVEIMGTAGTETE